MFINGAPLNLVAIGPDKGLSNTGGMSLPESMLTYCEMDRLESTPSSKALESVKATSM